MASFLARSALTTVARSGAFRGIARCAVPTGAAHLQPRACAAARAAWAVAPRMPMAAAFSTNAPLSAEDLPSNLVIDGLEELAEEPLAEFDDRELLRADLSEKVMPVVFLTAPEFDDDDDADADADADTDADADADTDDDADTDADTDADDVAQASSSGGGVAEEVVVLDNRVFGVPIRRDIAHRVVVWQRARWRAGTAHTKTRAEVSGGGRRPWKQKGSGRARHGSIRSPLWRGGGKAHGKKRRDFSFKLNRKVRQLGMRVALAAKFREGNLFVVDTEGVESTRTNDFVATLEDAGVFEEDGSVMLVDGDAAFDESRVAVAAGNLPWFSVYPQRGANVYAILKHHRLFLTRDALDELTTRLTRH